MTRHREPVAWNPTDRPPVVIDPLTEREVEVLLTYGRHGSIGAVAATLHLSDQTVKNHLSTIRAKLGVTSGVQAIYTYLTGAHIGTADIAAAAVQEAFLGEAMQRASIAAVDAMVETIDRQCGHGMARQRAQ